MKNTMYSNSVMVLSPYSSGGRGWIFDAPELNVYREAFVAGADSYIDLMTKNKDIIDAREGFKLTFSAGEFPGADDVVKWKEKVGAGDTYHSEKYNHDLWLCPCLRSFYPLAAPEQIYVKFDPIPEGIEKPSVNPPIAPWMNNMGGKFGSKFTYSDETIEALFRDLNVQYEDEVEEMANLEPLTLKEAMEIYGVGNLNQYDWE
jgi:hypothetical protein